LDVLIVETKTGELATRIPIALKGIGYSPSEDEYFNEAWNCAVQDETVDPNCREDYSFQLVQSTQAR
jgi:hypothetical protein